MQATVTKPGPDSAGRPSPAGHRPDPGLAAAATLAQLVSNGRWTIPLASWIAPVFLLRLVRTQPPLRGLSLAYLVILATWLLGWRGMVPLPGVFYYLLGAGLALVALLPLAVDRLLAQKVGGFASTLVLPLAWVAMEYGTAVLSPYGSWGALAYTQAGNLPLLQVLSLTGIYGVSFLMTWLAATVNWAWERAFRSEEVRTGFVLYGGVLSLVLLAGGARLAFVPPRGPTVAVASIAVEWGEAADIWRTLSGELDAAALELVRDKTRQLRERLFELSEQQSRAGARIVVWAELNGLMLKDDEPALLEHARRLARERDVYLFLALGSFTPGAPLMENKVVVVDPRGGSPLTYFKARPVPGDPETGGPERIQRLATPYGTLATAICFDMDFPGFIRQTGQSGADLMLVPAKDWREIDPVHTEMAALRAIENGVSLVRPTYGGLSASVDYQGRTLAAMDYFTTQPRVLVSHVPTRGVRTVYSSIGDTFAWLCVAALLALAGWLGTRSRLAARPTRA